MNDIEKEIEKISELETAPAVEDGVSPIPKKKKIKDLRDVLGEMKAAAMKTRLVTLTYNDKRDNNVVTSAYLTCENQYFGISRVVPLDVKIELEQCLIDTAKEAKILIHVGDGKGHGNMKPKEINKYNINYHNEG